MSGKLGGGVLSAETAEALYTVPEGRVASVSVSFCNANAEETAAISLAIGSGDTLDDPDTPALFLEYEIPVSPRGGILERSGLSLSAGEKIFVLASVDRVHVRVHGFEEEED